MSFSTRIHKVLCEHPKIVTELTAAASIKTNFNGYRRFISVNQQQQHRSATSRFATASTTTDYRRWNSSNTTTTTTTATSKDLDETNKAGLFVWLGSSSSSTSMTDDTNSLLQPNEPLRKLLLPIPQSTISNVNMLDGGDSVVQLVNHQYENVSSSEYIGGMGENDPGVWFATIQNSVKDPLDYALYIQQCIQQVKEQRHGVPFGLYTSGLLQQSSSSSTLEVPLSEIGLDFLHVSLFASTPNEYQIATRGRDTKNGAATTKEFGQICSIILEASECGIPVTVGVLRAHASSARDLAFSLGAVKVDVY